jgi:predicted acylesterase/phospholipase RssA
MSPLRRTRRLATGAPARATAAISLLVLALCGGGCASLSPRDPVPERLVAEAELASMPNVRVWGDAPAESIAAVVEAEKARKGAFEGGAFAAAHRRPGRQSPQLNIIAISGGGENGAFGAGLLVGWSDAGTRPDFDLVTGVSAGALIAPFVYLGRSRNVELKELFTKVTRSDIYDPGIMTPLFGSALVDSSPLETLIASYVDERFLRDVARERTKGRVLLIGTTNLDAERPVLWDMGRIAMSGHPHALGLFRKILLASASIPGAFPPVRIKVRAEGRTYEELHVDGGVTQQVFVPPPSQAVRDLAPAMRRSARRLFVIRNGKISPEWEAVEPGIFSISRRSVFTLIKNQSIGDLYRIFATAQIDGTDFNLAAIPSDFSVRWAEPFEPKYMQALYDEGYRLGSQGYSWMKAPPGLTGKPTRPASMEGLRLPE